VDLDVRESPLEIRRPVFLGRLEADLLCGLAYPRKKVQSCGTGGTFRAVVDSLLTGGTT
jgi:hypothetical protein